MKTVSKSPEEIKASVRARYNQISQQSAEFNASSCCGSGAASDEVYNIMNDDYNTVEGYQKEADLGLGCGLPTQFANIHPGDTVIDLGSGAGNDCFVARHETGPNGKVIGIDFAESMIAKARLNAEKLGFNNVEFRQGDLEAMPVSDSVADVVVSNCVLNLVPDKQRVFSEIIRVLKPGGHFSISDVVLSGDLPEALRKDAEMYAGCVSGAIQKEEYLGLIADSGFENVTIQKEKTIVLPDDILRRYLSEEELRKFKQSASGIYSITVYAQKPGAETGVQYETQTVMTSCQPGSGCC